MLIKIFDIVLMIELIIALIALTVLIIAVLIDKLDDFVN